MKKMISALAILGAMTLSACAHGGHHHDCCCSGECKMDKTASTGKSGKSCCGDECHMKDTKASAATTDTTTTK